MKRFNMYEITPSNYKKNGALKKNAISEWSMNISDSDTFPRANEAQFIAERIAHGRKIEGVKSPYIFTYILFDADGKHYAIYEEVYAGGQYITVSPTKLLKALEAL